MKTVAAEASQNRACIIKTNLLSIVSGLSVPLAIAAAVAVATQTHFFPKMLFVNDQSLPRWLGLYELFRIGRFELRFQTRPIWNRRLNRYRATDWTAWDLGWLRFYWHDACEPARQLSLESCRCDCVNCATGDHRGCYYLDGSCKGINA